jgi:hypothetical protein
MYASGPMIVLQKNGILNVPKCFCVSGALVCSELAFEAQLQLTGAGFMRLIGCLSTIDEGLAVNCSRTNCSLVATAG